MEKLTSVCFNISFSELGVNEIMDKVKYLRLYEANPFVLDSMALFLKKNLLKTHVLEFMVSAQWGVNIFLFI